MRLRENLSQGVRIGPDRTAIIFRDHEISFEALEKRVQELAETLSKWGVRAGSRLALLLPNCPAFVYCYYAADLLGAVSVPANPLLKAAELEYLWRDASVEVVLTIAALAPVVQAVREKIDTLKMIILDPDPDVVSLTRETCGTGPWEGEPRPLMQSDADERDCAVIIYTSGTTGHPKGAMLSHQNLTRNVEQVQSALHFTPIDRFLTVLPLFHSFAATVCMNTPLAAGCGSVLLESFSPGRVLEAIEKWRITIVPAVPAMFYALLQYRPEREFDLSSLRVFVSGGAPLPAATLQALEERFHVPVLEGDGPTECSPVTSVNRLEGARKVGSVGLPLPGVEVAIFDEQDRQLPSDAVGEIVVRGDNVMLGYLNLPEATAEVMTHGWYHTGDLGKIDSEGYIFIVDRKKDMIISAGLNVYPREVEEVLLTHPDIADAAVIGLPDSRRGEEVVAVVVPKPGASLSEREVIRFCRERLANYKSPRKVLVRETLPRGGTGKVVKRLLKKELELELNRA